MKTLLSKIKIPSYYPPLKTVGSDKHAKKGLNFIL